MRISSFPVNPALPSADHRTEEEAARRSRSLLILATLITVGLQFVPYSNYLLYPLRLFVTFVHESGHALATVVSGGIVESLTVFPNGEGVTMTRAPFWAQWLIDSGGYLGTALFGALLLQVGRFVRWKDSGRVALYLIAAYVCLFTLLFAHNPLTNLFTLVIGLLLAAALWTAGRYLSPDWSSFVAAFLAVQCSLNALGDLRILLNITSQHLGDNDALNMQRAYMLPEQFWAALWAAIAVVLLGAALRSYWRATAVGVRRTLPMP